MTVLFDLSPAVGPDAPVFPGDVPFSARSTFAHGPGCPVEVAAVTLSPHAGAHADAPRHFDPRGPAIDEVPLDAYLGPCRVVHAIGAGPRVLPRHVEARLAGAPPRVLVRTYARQPAAWDPAFAALAPELVELLGARGAVLVGTDAASLDPADSKTLDAHHAARRRGLAILEGLVLDEVPEGDYELVALPLRWRGLDAAPVRAVLRALPGGHP